MQIITTGDEPLIRPMERADLDEMVRWARHSDVLFEPYNVPRMSSREQDGFWERMTSDPSRLMIAGLVRERFVAHIIIRGLDRAAQTGELGIALDPAWIGQGLGKRILRALFTYLREREGLHALTLEVAAYNHRALAAYRAVGFTEVRRRFLPADAPIDYRNLVRRPDYAWLAPYVRSTPGGAAIEVIRMSALFPASERVLDR